MRSGAARPGGRPGPLWHEERGRKEGCSPAGRLVISRLSEGLVTWALGLRGLAEKECVQAQRCPWVEYFAGTVCHGHTPVLCVLWRKHSPFSHERPTPPEFSWSSSLFFHYCSREFCRTGARCEVAGLGVGSWSVVESGTVSFARRYLASKGHHRWRSGEESACRCGRRIAFLSWEDPLEEEMAVHSSNLAWRTPWTEEPGGLQSVGLQRVRRGDTQTHTQTHTHKESDAGTHTHTRGHTHRHKESDAGTHTHTRAGKHRYTQTQRHTDTKSQTRGHTDTHTDTQRHTHTKSQTRGHTHTHTHTGPEAGASRTAASLS